jgi:hypothetical protein
VAVTAGCEPHCQLGEWAFIASLVVGVIATVLIVWMSGVKEAYWEKDRGDSAERIAQLVVQGDRLRNDTAEANARATNAQLALEKLKAPRSMQAAQMPPLVTLLSAFAGTNAAVYVLGEGPEPNSLAALIAGILKQAR